METKILELRDKHTMIPVLAIKLSAADRTQAYYLHLRCGYPVNGNSVMITHLTGERMASANPYHWSDRTWRYGHHFIDQNFDKLADGDVVDVEYILGETKAPKRSERLEP